jgi:hypothetical protein
MTTDRDTEPKEGFRFPVSEQSTRPEADEDEAETEGHIWRGGVVPPELGEDERNEAGRWGAADEGGAKVEPETEGHAWFKAGAVQPEASETEPEVEGHAVTPPLTAMQREEPEVEGHMINVRRPIIRD